MEGYNEAFWILIDLADVVVPCFPVKTEERVIIMTMLKSYIKMHH